MNFPRNFLKQLMLWDIGNLTPTIGWQHQRKESVQSKEVHVFDDLVFGNSKHSDGMHVLA